MAQTVRNLPALQEKWALSLGWEDPIEKGMATHSGIPTWRIPLTEEPDWLQSTGHKESDTTEGLTLFIKHYLIFMCLYLSSNGIIQ